MSDEKEQRPAAEPRGNTGTPSGQTRRRYEAPVLKRWGPIEDYTAGDTGGNTDGGSPAPKSTMLL
jgi:hypothetical protein